MPIAKNTICRGATLDMKKIDVARMEAARRG
jgi:hypothetical protein